MCAALLRRKRLPHSNGCFLSNRKEWTRQTHERRCKRRWARWEKRREEKPCRQIVSRWSDCVCTLQQNQRLHSHSHLIRSLVAGEKLKTICIQLEHGPYRDDGSKSAFASILRGLAAFACGRWSVFNRHVSTVQQMQCDVTCSRSVSMSNRTKRRDRHRHQAWITFRIRHPGVFVRIGNDSATIKSFGIGKNQHWKWEEEPHENASRLIELGWIIATPYPRIAFRFSHSSCVSTSVHHMFNC